MHAELVTNIASLATWRVQFDHFQLTELHVLNAYPRFLGEIYRWVYGV